MAAYCLRSDVESVFGATNIASWAALDNDQAAAKITARIDRAIEIAGAEVEDLMRYMGYAVPVKDSAGLVPTTIENLVATMAGLWLYEARGVNDTDQQGNPMHRLRYMRMWARNMFKEIANGTRKLDANL